MGIAATASEWGSTPAERARSFACDALLASYDRELHRAVGVAAPPAAVFAWLCQLRVAPYSYDWLDNWGRRSPRERSPELEELAVGQRFMTIFRLESFEPERQITLLHRSRVFGIVAVTYALEPAPGGSRLVVKLRVKDPAPPVGWITGPLLPFGDLVMMRKQLHTLRDLAERDAQRAAHA
ncbi:MAG: hypothetical protein ACR2NH_11645 [Solirubrobacteraceae bacterium]